MVEKNAMVIPPVGLLDTCSTRHHLVLVPYYRSIEAYKNFYRRRSFQNDFIIQDNGAAELKKSVQVSDLIAVAEDLHPTLMVAPDVIYNMQATMDGTMKFVADYGKWCEEHRIGILAVPQGKTPEEWIKCYTLFNNCPGISWLGISMFHAKTFGDRLTILKAIEHTVDKPCHLLGLWNDPHTLLQEREFDFVRSVDTAKPVEFGLEQLSLRRWREHQHLDDDWYMGLSFEGTKQHHEQIRRNVAQYIALFNNGTPIDRD